ncbi:MAG: SMP-30/gluconolactonase/LRE family protein [Myxococcales bacterium]|nr:SMP-30/gluconolactonase/LRE family protein [Myxococcales bacterium]MCB9716907.1 SMP-30/gluconolactonase/LRE family protein [Myxococcales bacterium]
MVMVLLLALASCGDDSPPAGSSGPGSSGPGSSGGTGLDGSGSSGPVGTGSGSSDEGSDGSSTTGELGCLGDLGFGEVEVFYDGFTGGSEGIAFGADGDLYVTTSDMGDGIVWRLDEAAALSEHAAVPSALGLAGRGDGSLVVASIGVNGMPDGAVYVVDAAGVASELATGIDSPNFVTIAPDGSALVSDDFDTRVFRVAPDGMVSVAIADVPSPNGMAYSPDGAWLYVASTFSADGQLTRYEVDGDGMPIEASAVEILHLGPGSTPDGIAVDEDGRVYVAANLFGEIWRVDGAAPEVVEGELVAEGLGSPASLAFGRGPGFDPCSIYVTQLFGDRVLRVGVGMMGAMLYE